MPSLFSVRAPRRLAPLLLGLALLFWGGSSPFGSTPDSGSLHAAEVCSVDAVSIVDFGTVDVSIEVGEEVAVDDVRVAIEITHTFIGDLVITVASPAETTVTLFDESGGSGDDLRLTFAADGVAFGSDPFTCECDMQPEGPGALADFDGERSLGVWRLVVHDTAPTDDGTLDQWCVDPTGTDCTVAAPTVTCVRLESATAPFGDVEVSFTGSLDFDSYQILRDGVEIGTALDDATPFLDVDVPDATLIYEVVGIRDADACDARSVGCVVGRVSPCFAIVEGETFIRGELNGNGSIDLGDPIALLAGLFLDGVDLDCLDAADVNDDGVAELADALDLLGYLYGGATPPPAPFPACGFDRTSDAIDCEISPAACPSGGGDAPTVAFAFDATAGERVWIDRIPPTFDPESFTSEQFDAARFGLRPFTLDSSSAGGVSLSVVGDASFELFTDAGERLPLPTTIDAADLPADLLLGATGSGRGTLFALDLGNGVPTCLEIEGAALGGLAGRTLPVFPWFEQVRSINEEDGSVQVALDPTRHRDRVGLSFDIYVVDHQSPSEWVADNTLVDVTGDVETATLTAGSIRDNIFEVWAGPLDGGDRFANAYDVIFDFGQDGTLDPGDLISGFSSGSAGLYVCRELSLDGPHTVETEIYSGGFNLGQILYYPTDIADLGEVPLVIMGHGNGHLYTWYDYLGDFLASHGYVFMSHQNNTGPGPDAASLTTINNTDYLLANLDTIAGGALEGHIDLDKICWLGHSRGGEGVVRAYDRLVDGNNNPDEYDETNILFVSSIAPTVFLNSTSANPHGVNYHMLLGGADGDVTGGPESPVTQSLRIHSTATGNTSVTYLHAAKHNDFNCCGFFDGEGPAQIGRVEAQRVTQAIYLAFLEHYTRDNRAATDFLVRAFDSFRPQGLDVDVRIANQWYDPGSNVRIIDDCQNNVPGISTSGEDVIFDGLTAFEGRMDDPNDDLADVAGETFNGMTYAELASETQRGMVLSWGDEPASAEWVIAESDQDWRNAEFLAFRACQRTRNPSTVNPLSFVVAIEDTSGRRSAIDFSPFGRLTDPYPRAGNGTGEGWSNEFCRVRLRLTDFLNDGRFVDLSQIARLRFEFGGGRASARGSIGLDDVVLANE